MLEAEERILDFNSIKVRLELEVQVNNMKTGQKFQFHKGAIRTICTCSERTSGRLISIP